jgi:hypothetical protein
MKYNKDFKKEELFFYFSDVWVLRRVNQPSRQQDRDRLRGDRPTGSAEQFLFLFQLFAEMSIAFVSVYPSYISGR